MIGRGSSGEDEDLGRADRAVAGGRRQAPIAGATVACELAPQRTGPDDVDARTVTRADGSFELSGIPAGPVAIWVHAEGYRARMEAGMTARDGAAIGPIAIALTRLGPDVARGVDMVGIGVQLVIDGDALQVVGVLPGSGAFDAGVAQGDRVIAVDGVAVGELGLEGALARIRGQPGTTVTLTLQRDGRNVQLVVERRLLRT